MSKAKCFAPVRGNAMRVTRLDRCGRPVYGDNAVSVTEGFVSVEFTRNMVEGDAITSTTASGKQCVNEPATSTLSNYAAAITFCNVDPGLFSLITGQEAEVDPDTGELIGFSEDSSVNPADSGFALEVWTGVSTGGSGCSGEGSQGQFGYIILPFMQGGLIGDLTIENAAINFVIDGAQTKVGAQWGSGPYDVQLSGGVPGPLVNPIKPTQHRRIMVTEVAPPEPVCGSVPLLDPSTAGVDSITGTVDDGDPYTYAFEPSPAGSDPMWYDFGDGTWDYTEDGSISHTYDSEGEFTVVGHRGNSEASTTVTVTAP